MKKWITVPANELDNINYADTRITNAGSAPKNLAGDTALIKWVGDMPSSISAITGKSEVMTHEQAIALLQSDAWYDSEVI